MPDEKIPRTIPLTQGKVATIDVEDYERISVNRWFAKFHHGNWYAYRKVGTGKGSVSFMHRVVLSAIPSIKIDHKDGDGLNNRRDNLRVATDSQNQFNAKRRKDNSSGFKGVQIYCGNGQRTKQWKAQIRHHGHVIYLGKFDDPAEAARIYDSKAKELFGEFARLNFPQEGTT